MQNPLLLINIKFKTMISGIHFIMYSKDSKADREFFRDVLELTNVDVGDGWLIFGAPPSELAVHPGPDNGNHEIYFMSDDIESFIDEMLKRNIACEPIQNQGWGLLTSLTLPGGGKLGVYEPRHARPKAMKKKKRTKKADKAKAKKIKTKTKKSTDRKSKKKSKRK